MSTAAELSLRDYQARTFALVHDAIRAGKRKVLVVAPTGSGKRMMLVWECRKASNQERESLMVTDRRLLVEQAADEFAAHDIPCGIVMSGYHEDRLPRIQLASIQSLESRYIKGDLQGLPPADLVCIDEAHKATEKYQQLLQRYPNAVVLLFTATPVGKQGRSLIGPGFADCMVEGVKNSELIRRKFLLPTEVVAPSEPDIEGVKIVKGDYAQGPLGEEVARCTTFSNLFNDWAPFADRQTIVFAPGIDYCNGLLGGPGIPGDSFYARGIPAAVLTSKVKPKDRVRIFEQFAGAEIRVLITVDVCREGFDCPRASCAIDLQPTLQFRTYWQKLGRVKRPYGDQERAVYIDMAGNYWRFPYGPEDDPDWDEVSGETSIQDVIERNLAGAKATRRCRCPKCATVYKAAPKCPSCGHEPKDKEIIRRIRMGNNKLKSIPATEKRRKVLTDDDRKCNKWKSALFTGLKTGKTLSQCLWIYRNRNKESVPNGLPCMPKPGSAQWNQRVDQVFTGQQLMSAFAARSAQNQAAQQGEVF